ncbi:MAG: secondary thiamine-phosphate synthase enzyme YjbQ [Myxococcales bacterium]|nr:secondary thiamine-phosphate synthase enzyme YjbQ [Myxococcales bacterium]
MAMVTSIQKFDVRSRDREELIDVTRQVTEAIRASGVTSGLCTIFVPHTTAAVTIHENADPDVPRDLVHAFARAIPNEGFRHGEGNSDAHAKASLVGNSETLLVDGGAPALGTWQGVFFCEFDGPRTRQVWVKVVADHL